MGISMTRSMTRTKKTIDGKRVNVYIVNGVTYFSAKEAKIAAGTSNTTRKSSREYKSADASLLKSYLANRDMDSLPLEVVSLYSAAIALTMDWSSKDVGKLEQLLWLSKCLPDYTPASIKKYCSCSGTESRRLSLALRSIAAVIAPYAVDDAAWAYDMAFFNRINAGAEYPHSDGIIGGKKTRIGFAEDLIAGDIGGLNSMVGYNEGWGVGLDTTPVVAGRRYSKWQESEEYSAAEYSGAGEWEAELCKLQADAVNYVYINSALN